MCLKGYKQTEEHKRKQCLARTGKKRSKESIQKMSESHKGKISNRKGKTSPMNGIPRSEKTRLKIAQSKKGIKLSEEHKKKLCISSYIKGKHLSKEIKLKISITNSGESHWNWKGGISFEPYCSKFNNMLKEKIRERDNRTCQLCGKTEQNEDKKLSVHHIHYDKENCNPDLISLCKRCNTTVNYNRNYWEEIFMNKLNDRNLLLCVEILKNYE